MANVSAGATGATGAGRPGDREERFPNTAGRAHGAESEGAAAVTPLRVNRGFYHRFAKRAIDVVGAAVLLVLLAPAMSLLALAIAATMGTPVLFRQQRVGLDGRPFTMLKFRSMGPDRRVARLPYAGPERRAPAGSSPDPRITRLGRFIRRYSLDELPQLFNVVRGDMSLVGPRPEQLTVAMKLGLIDHPRHRVRPGLTGPWQVSDRRPGLVHENLDLDLHYLRTVGLRTDISIMRRTVKVVALGAGA